MWLKPGPNVGMAMIYKERALSTRHQLENTWATDMLLHHQKDTCLYSEGRSQPPPSTAVTSEPPPHLLKYLPEREILLCPDSKRICGRRLSTQKANDLELAGLWTGRMPLASIPGSSKWNLLSRNSWTVTAEFSSQGGKREGMTDVLPTTDVITDSAQPLAFGN